MINYMALCMALGFGAMFLFMIYEKARFVTGRETFIEKLIGLLERVYQRTELQKKIKKDVRTYQLTEKVIVKKVYFDD